MTTAFDAPEPQAWRLMDQLRGWRGPFGPDELVAIFAGLLYASATSASHPSVRSFDLGFWADSDLDPAASEQIARAVYLELADDELVEPVVDVLAGLIARAPSALVARMLQWFHTLPLGTPGGLAAAQDTLDIVCAYFAEQRGIAEQYTPLPIAELMVAVADPRPGERIYDPCFGLGGLLSAAGRKLAMEEGASDWTSKENIRPSFEGELIGIELNQASYLVGTVRVALTGARAKLRLGDSFRSAYSDLRHHTPVSDKEFRKLVAVHVASALASAERDDLAGWLRPANEVTQDSLELLFSELDDASARILMVLDGFDSVLKAPEITRNWWDNLRDLAGHRSLCLVTGSRARLRELCITEGSQTSDLWEIFNPTPLRVESFDGSDWDSLLKPFETRGSSVDQSGRKELSNWTGGIPLLTAGMLELLYARTPGQQLVSKSDVDQAADVFLEERDDLLGGLWADCSEGVKQSLVDLATKGEMASASFSDGVRRELLERGLAEERGQGRLKLATRLGDRYARSQEPSTGSLRRLFASPEDYLENMTAALELRLLQLNGADPTLRALVQKAVREVASAGDSVPAETNALVYFRIIEDRALQLIWDAELPSKPRLPQEWVDSLEYPDRYRAHDGTYTVGGNRGLQRALLRHAVSSQWGLPLARHTSRQTSILVDTVGSAGDLGQHLDGANVSKSFTLAACHTAVELCECLALHLTAHTAPGTML